MKFLLVWAITVAVLLYLTVSTLDFHAAKAMDRNYTAMVCQGVWPNFKNRDIDCDD